MYRSLLLHHLSNPLHESSLIPYHTRTVEEVPVKTKIIQNCNRKLTYNNNDNIKQKNHIDE